MANEEKLFILNRASKFGTTGGFLIQEQAQLASRTCPGGRCQGRPGASESKGPHHADLIIWSASVWRASPNG
jgi:hypothetical protein